MKGKYGQINDWVHGSYDSWTSYQKKVYCTWYNMLRRSKDSEYKKNHPTYSNVDCCDDWLILSKFESDIRQIPGYTSWKSVEGWDLDKDYPNKTNLYSPCTCRFIDHGSNVRLAYSQNPNQILSLISLAHTKESLDKLADSKSRAVVSFSPTGDMAEWRSGMDIHRSLGIDDETVYGCCRGKDGKYGGSGPHTVSRGKWKGWTFMYREDYYNGEY